MRLNRTLALIPAVAAAVALASPPAADAGGQKWYDKAVKRVSASFTPAEAKPGQTVTFSLTVELNDGYHTYPTAQSDKAAATMVNAIKFPDPGAVIFVGSVQDPKGGKTKAEPMAVPPIKEYRYYPGTVTYTRKAVVSPKATPGKAAVKLTAFKLSVCSEDVCYPPKDVPVEAELKVLDGPAVEVEKDYAEDVAKALAGK